VLPTTDRSKLFVLTLALLFLAICQKKISEPVLDYSSEKFISCRYDGYASRPTLPAKVRDMAQRQCEKFGKMLFTRVVGL
jgi:hypothetical protein